MIKFLYLYSFFFVLTFPLKAQVTLSGPMQGYSTDSTANVWMMIAKDQFSLSFELLNDEHAVITSKSTCHKKWCSYSLEIQNISNPKSKLKITSEKSEQLFDFKCSNASQDTAFSFLLGSCTFRWGPLLPLMPSNGYKIFRSMNQEEANLMLWLGDNVYYLFGDHKSEALMFKENAKNRKQKAMSNFIQSKQHFAIWDDHDYGPNNSLGSYDKKEISKKVFDDFWVNPPNNSEGNYYSFQYANAEFFMLDSRWFKTEPDNQPNSLLGEIQLKWLIDGLKNSKATFKFVALGSQIINPMGLNHERFASYTEEYNSLLKTAASLDNVVFLSGDMHYSTVFKNEDFGKPLYEFSCSPLSAMRYNIRKNNDEFNNPYFVEGTQYNEQNFGKVTINGNQCTFEVFDNEGQKVWIYKLE